jgi:hypothetical protein
VNIVNTDAAGAARESMATQMYRERVYPQLDCVGSYLWIWERLVQTAGRVETVARKIDRSGPSAVPEPESADG